MRKLLAVVAILLIAATAFAAGRSTSTTTGSVTCMAGSTLTFFVMDSGTGRGIGASAADKRNINRVTFVMSEEQLDSLAALALETKAEFLKQ